MRASPEDAAAVVRTRARQEEDPWAMYYVVRNDRPLSFAQAMALGGAGAVACADRFRCSERWAANFAAWQARAHPKIALRADAKRFEEVAELDGALIATPAGPTMLCLPPRRKSEREPLLIELAPFTDAKRPAQAPAPAIGALIYVIRPDVLKSMGKAMAQAGHAALSVVDSLGATHGAELRQWRAQGMAGDVRLADEQTWERLKAEIDCVVVKDAGFTQVAPGTETVLGLPPLSKEPDLLRALERVT
jgi:peptidyl-tRNA hydrolase